MNGGISGFQNAPVTRTVVIASAILTVFTRVQSRSVSLGGSLKDIFGFHPLKSIASIFAFSSTPELMFGIYLLYYFRVLERQIGSNKYSVFSLFSMIVAMLFEILALTILKDPTLNSLVSGPYSLIFSSFVPFYFDIPVSTRICIFSVNFSDKSFIYLAGLQLLLSSWKRSLLPGLCGVFSGALYRLNIFGIRQMKFPDFFASSFSRLRWPTFGGSSVASDGNVNASIPYTNVHTEVNYPSFTLASSIRESFEDSVAKLVSMGFDRNSAIQALNQSGNDINGATNILLEAQSH